MKKPSVTTSVIQEFESQGELFTSWLSVESKQSRTVDLFDAIPKYIFDKKSKTTAVIGALTRDFEFRDVRYNVEIAPATVKRGQKYIGVYPGEREEIVARTLLYMSTQKLATLRLGSDKDGDIQISASFTLSQLRKQLVDFKHDYKLSEIDEALQVCHGAMMRLAAEGGTKGAFQQSGIFMFYSGQNTKGDKTGDEAYRHVVFNPLVTASILENTVRAINFERVMALKSPLSRWLYDRLSHNFRQMVKAGALLDKGYNLSLRTILRESGFAAEGRIRASVELVRKALKELQLRGVLEVRLPYKEELTYGEPPARGPRPIEDVIWTLYPSSDVVEETIQENKARKALK